MQRVHYSCPPAPLPYFLRQCNHGNEILREVTKSLAPSPVQSAFMTVEQKWLCVGKHTDTHTHTHTHTHTQAKRFAIWLWQIMRVINMSLKWVIDGWRASWVAGPSTIANLEMTVSWPRWRKHNKAVSIMMLQWQCQSFYLAWLTHLIETVDGIFWIIE